MFGVGLEIAIDRPHTLQIIAVADPVVTSPGAALSHVERLLSLAATVSGCASGVLVLHAALDCSGSVQAGTGLTPGEIAAIIAYAGTVPPLPGVTTWSALSNQPLPGERRGPLPAGFPACGFLAHRTLREAGGEVVGFLVVTDVAARDELDAAQQAGLVAVADLIIADQEREGRQARLWTVTSRSMRADRMMRMVSEAVSCTDALTGLLEELCRFHGATIGRMWQLNSGDQTMTEISRFNDETLDAHSYFRQEPRERLSSKNMFVAEAILANAPRSVRYAEVEDRSHFVLMDAAISAGLIGQVSYPIHVQDQMFGVSLAFSNTDIDLYAVQADVAGLANTIRPALFRKVNEERTRHVAHHDDLTQLANRLVFQERLTEALSRATTQQNGVALLYLDLDGFKTVNDTRGHEVGDKLLTAVAGRLRDSVRAEDTVARVGGDEFAIIQIIENSPAAATKLARRLIEAVATPFELGGHNIVIGVSIGIALHPGHGDTPDLLLRHADTALYRAKDSGRNTFRVFDPAMDIRHQERLLIERDLGDAINARQFKLAFQPICHAGTLATFGFEALLRWDHPTRGPIDPAQFVRLAEMSGLILPLGQWALEAACAEAVQWPGDVRVSVNLSPLQFRQPSLPRIVAETLARAGLPGTRLDFEVTEGLLLEDSSLVLNTMYALKDQGISISLDDFGTAYASLSYLRSFPFDRIKIDKSFTQAMCDDDATLAIVEAVLSLSARLNLRVVAEGVETERELAMLRRLGCGLVQGYLTGRPMPGENARARLARALV